MRNIRYLLLLCATITLLTTCSKSGVQVLSFTPAGEVEDFTTFQIDFNEPLAPDDKIGEWLEEKFVEFEPALSGKSKWLNPNTLIFSPDKGLKPGQDYTAHITDKVLFGNGKSSNFETYTFHSPYFDALGAEFFWTQIPRSDFKVTVTANLTFNYEVDPAQLGDYLEIEKGGKVISDYRIVTSAPSNVIAIDFGKQQQTEKEQNFVLRVKKGLKSVESTGAMTEARKFTISLAPLTRLAITSVSSGYNGKKGWIEVFTTQAVDDKVLNKYIKLDPRKKFITTTTPNSFRIEGKFAAGSEIKLLIKKGLPGMFGGKLPEDYTQTVALADLNPKLNFADKKGQYLMRGGMENLLVEAINVERADVRIYEVYENNLLFYLYQTGSNYYTDRCCGANNSTAYNRGSFYEEDYYEDDYYYGGYSNVGDYGKLIYEDSVIFPHDKNRLNQFTVNMSQHLDQRFKGIYVVELRDYTDYWRRDSKFFSVSDLGLIVKRSRNELLVFVNSIASTEPVAGVEVNLISSNNQTLLSGTTDASGVITFQDIKGKVEDYTPRMVTARKGQDFNFVDFRETEIGLSRYDVGGKQEYSEEYDTYLYADRNLFRPGEAAHFNAIVRNKALDVVKDIPVKFKIISPRGKTFFEAKKTLGQQGSAEIEVKLPNYAETGDYTLELISGSDQMLSSYSFSVEEFVPDKIRVEANASKKAIDPGATVDIDIFSEYLFGAPCNEHAYELDINLRHRPFKSKKYPKYTFSPSGISNSYLENDLITGKLDEEGKHTVSWKSPSDLQTSGIISATGYATVFDATGRTVTRTVDFAIYPNKYLLGLRSGKYYYHTGEQLSFKAMAVNSRDKALSGFTAEVEVLRHEWKSVLKRDGNNRYYYQSEKQLISESKKRITINGKPTSFSFMAKKSGRYEVRLRKPGEDRYTRITFYAYGSSSTTASSFEVDREGRIEIQPDKEVYAPGDRAKILFQAPFSGKMLVTLEQNHILEHHYIQVENNSASFEFDVTDAHLPNFFVSATLFKPHAKHSATPFLVGHGYRPIRVEKKENRIAVEIKAPDRIKPRKSQEIVIKAGSSENVYVTLALVDEGILQIKNYKSPDPYKYMYANRKLSVSSYDIYEKLLQEIMSVGSSVAGGDEEGAGKRTNPITAQRFKLLSYWSGTRRTDANGEVRIRVPIPQFNGSARLMAVAYSNASFGAAEKRMKITDDVVVMPAIPRFLSPRDSIVLPISLLNTTSKSGKVTVKVRTEGPLKVSSKSSQTVSIKGNGNANVRFGIQVDNSVGLGKIFIETTGLDKVSDEIEIAVRPTSPLVVEDGFLMLKAGESKSIQIPKGFIPATQNSQISISKFPAVQHAKHLDYLLGYPHGCVEQTTSKLFPQLYFEDLVATIAPNTYINGNPVYFINEGIRKLQSMQLYNGALSYWQGGSYSSWWGSAYAAHFLVEAKRAGYKVSESMLNRLLKHLQGKASQKSTFSYSYYENGSMTKSVKANKEVLYSLFVLALAKRGDLSLMNYYRARMHLLTGDTRYLLAGAYGLMNDWAAFRAVLPEAFLAETPVRESGGSFDSEARAVAMMLNVLLEVDPNNKQIPGLIRYISKLGNKVYSTQDRAWIFLALGKAAGKNSKSKVKVAISAGGKSIGIYDNEDWTLNSDGLNAKRITLKASGTGSVYVFWKTEGIKASGDASVVEVDKNLKVRRKWYTRDGSPLSETAVLHQGDLIVSEIQLSTGLRGVENLAVSDLIPAGFEIENPRLGTSSSLNWIKTNLNPQHLDVRDDRLLLFTDMPSNAKRKFFYMMRAVNAGRFRLAPIGAEAMYDPEFKSYHGARTVEVAPR